MWVDNHLRLFVFNSFTLAHATFLSSNQTNSKKCLLQPFWLNAAGHLINRQTRERVGQKAAPNILDLAAGRGTGGRNLPC